MLGRYDRSFRVWSECSWILKIVKNVNRVISHQQYMPIFIDSFIVSNVLESFGLLLRWYAFFFSISRRRSRRHHRYWSSLTAHYFQGCSFDLQLRSWNCILHFANASNDASIECMYTYCTLEYRWWQCWFTLFTIRVHASFAEKMIPDEVRYRLIRNQLSSIFIKTEQELCDLEKIFNYCKREHWTVCCHRPTNKTHWQTLNNRAILNLLLSIMATTTPTMLIIARDSAFFPLTLLLFVFFFSAVCSDLMSLLYLSTTPKKNG